MAPRHSQGMPFSAEEAAGEARVGDTLRVTGDLWRLFSPPARFAFLMGLAQPLHPAAGTVEPASLTTRDALSHLLPALRDEPLREVARLLDRYYGDQPARRERPVIEALVEIYVLPRLALARGDA